MQQAENSKSGVSGFAMAGFKIEVISYVKVYTNYRILRSVF